MRALPRRQRLAAACRLRSGVRRNDALPCRSPVRTFAQDLNNHGPGGHDLTLGNIFIWIYRSHQTRCPRAGPDRSAGRAACVEIFSLRERGPAPSRSAGAPTGAVACLRRYIRIGITISTIWTAKLRASVPCPRGRLARAVSSPGTFSRRTPHSPRPRDSARLPHPCRRPTSGAPHAPSSHATGSDLIFSGSDLSFAAEGRADERASGAMTFCPTYPGR